MPDAQRRQDTGRYHRRREADAEAHDQQETERELLQLNARQENSDRSRARDESTGQAEHHDLAGRNGAALEATANVIGMGPSVCIVLVAEVHMAVAVTVFAERDFKIMPMV